MEKEEALVKKIKGKFNFLEGECKVARIRRIWIEITKDKIMEFIKYMKNDLGFNFLCTITGLDCIEYYQVIYHFANDDGIIINLKLNVPKDNPKIESIIGIFEGSIFYERELKDMLGIEVIGLPQGRRYPLPDDWPIDQHPLRKEWKPVVSSAVKEA